MSQDQPSPTSSPSSQPSSQTLKLVEQAEQLDAEKITIRYAETDQDVVAIHQFLLVVAAPDALCPIDPIESLQEVIRITQDNVALMAIKDGRLIGTLGIINVGFWYNSSYSFMTDRWQHVLPQFRNGDVNRMLEAEADSIAEAAGQKFIHQGKIRGKRGRLMLFPRLSVPESDTLGKRKA